MRMLGNRRRPDHDRVRRGRAAVSVVVMLRRSARDLDLTEQVVLTVDQFGAVYVGAMRGDSAAEGRDRDEVVVADRHTRGVGARGQVR